VECFLGIERRADGVEWRREEDRIQGRIKIMQVQPVLSTGRVVSVEG
jgi:hypothetical protein